MKKKIITFIIMGIAILICGVNAQTVDTVTVTFLINTATIPDTLQPTSTVQVRGSETPLTWTYLTGVRAVNISGDYWTATAKFLLNRGDTSRFRYKFFTNVKDSITATDVGWENNLSGNLTIDSSNRALRFGPYTGNKDTTIALQYANGGGVQPQWWKPYVPSADSVAVLFRVNMQGDQNFSGTTMKLGVRGNVAPLSWSNTIWLTREKNHGNTGQDAYDGTNFWSAWVKFPKTTPAGEIDYKFAIHAITDSANATPTYETNILTASDVQNGGNRFFMFNPTMADSTLVWKWWQNMSPGLLSFPDKVIITFKADLAAAISANGFSYSDSLFVEAGFNSSADSVYTTKMKRVGVSSKYQAADTIKTKLGTADTPRISLLPIL